MVVLLSVLDATRLATLRVARCGIDLVARRRLHVCSRPCSLLTARHREAVTSPKRYIPRTCPTWSVVETRRQFQSQAGTEPGLDPNDNANDGDGDSLPQDAHTVYQVCMLKISLIPVSRSSRDDVP